MPTYLYRCKCGAEVEVLRPLAEIDVLPETCPSCQDPEFKRVIGGTQFLGKKQKGYYNSVNQPADKQHHVDR